MQSHGPGDTTGGRVSDESARAFLQRMVRDYGFIMSQQDRWRLGQLVQSLPPAESPMPGELVAWLEETARMADSAELWHIQSRLKSAADIVSAVA